MKYALMKPCKAKDTYNESFWLNNVVEVLNEYGNFINANIIDLVRLRNSTLTKKVWRSLYFKKYFIISESKEYLLSIIDKRNTK